MVVKAVVVKLLHTCHSGLLIIIENSKKFTITGLQEADCKLNFAHFLWCSLEQALNFL